MPSITAILTAFRRPQNIRPLVEAIRRQTAQPAAVWAWANEPSDKMRALLAEAKLDRVVTLSDNARFHGRFALALLARTEFVAIFDDDSIPGENWFANCLETMSGTPGILGTAGVVLHEPGYAKRTMHGWQRPTDETVEVDLVGQAWLLRSAWVKHLFSVPPVTGTNGEDIELAARAWRLAGIRSFCPPHPAADRSRWGSTRGLELGLDEVAASLRVEHLAERKTIVEAEMAAGWQPLFMRKAAEIQDAIESPPLPAVAARDCQINDAYGSPRWVAESTAPGSSTLRLEGVEGDRRCRNCIEKIESLGAQLLSEGLQPTYGRIDCGAALEHVRDPLVFLHRVNRLLKPGGKLLGHVANVRRSAIVQGLIDGRWAGTREGALRFFSRREIEKLFYRAGFRVCAIEPSPAVCIALAPQADRAGICAAPVFAESPCPEKLKHDRYQITAVAEPRPDYGLTSIVIVTHNQLGCTRACLDSIRFVTDEPYELIVVDNGSTDGTVDYLRNCADVRLIANANNRGFPAAVNQGIAAGSGKQVLLLNNDVLVTTGWLRRMLDVLESEAFADAERPEGKPLPEGNGASRVGLVGPLANCASGYQEIEVTYSDLAMLDGFAWEHAKANARQVQEVDRLIGFCVLIRREVINQVGLFDERFGIGNYEDDDYCRRAREAGWRLVVARDAYIHHFGHKTFDGAGVDLGAMLKNNKRLYDEKWAPKPPALPLRPGDGRGEGGMHHPARQDSEPAASGESHPSPILSLCMIVRDNEHTIRPCLESIKPWVDEMIVVDTGSKDATPDICRELGAQVYHFPWPDSFAIARNESLKYARGEWIFWMDSDDVIDAENGRKLRELVNTLPLSPAERSGEGVSLPLPSGKDRGEGHSHHPAASINFRPAAPSNIFGYVVQVHCPSTGKDGFHEWTVVDHVKLFRNRPDLRFEGRIHEQIIPAIRWAGGEISWTDLFVVHAGAAQTPEEKQRKLERDLRLLRLELAERPDHPFVHFNLGMTYEVAGRYDEAIAALTRSLKLADPGDSQVRKAYSLLIGCLGRVGQHQEAWRKCQEALVHFPRDAELLFRHGQLCQHLGRLAEAEQAYRTVLANDEPRHFVSIDSGILGFKTHHNLALVYAEMRDLPRSEEQWRQATLCAPDHVDGWRGLGETLMRQGKYDELERLVPEAIARPALRGLALVWQAQPLRARRQLTEAGHLLQRAFEELPDDPDVVQAGCQLLFEVGDMTQCEQALGHLLRLMPDNPAAHYNLGTVYMRMGHPDEALAPLRRSLELSPNSVAAHIHLGHALLGVGQPSDAVRAFSEALRFEPDNPHAQDGLAKACARLPLPPGEGWGGGGWNNTDGRHLTNDGEASVADFARGRA